VLDKFENGTPEEKEDSKNTLMQDMEQFKQKLQPLVDTGNEDAVKIMNRLNAIKL
jgi:hypothetical protein